MSQLQTARFTKPLEYRGPLYKNTLLKKGDKSFLIKNGKFPFNHFFYHLINGNSVQIWPVGILYVKMKSCVLVHSPGGMCVMTFQNVASLAHYADAAEETKQMC